MNLLEIISDNSKKGFNPFNPVLLGTLEKKSFPKFVSCDGES